MKIIPLALVIFFAQSVFSAIWLRRFRQGPAEALWRRLSASARSASST